MTHLKRHPLWQRDLDLHRVARKLEGLEIETSEYLASVPKEGLASVTAIAGAPMCVSENEHTLTIRLANGDAALVETIDAAGRLRLVALVKHAP